MSQQGYIGRNPGDGRTIVNRQTSHVTTGVQTSFTMTVGYEVGYLDVYLNGIKQTETLDYTASDGSTINFSLSYPPVNGDVLEFVAFETLNISNIKSARRNFSVGQDLDVSGKVTIGSSLTVASDLVVNGTFTTINTEILDVEDKTVGIASTSSPSNTTADGAGIVIYGGSDGDKSLTWNSTKSNFVLVGGGVSIGTGVTISTPAANVLAFSVNSAEKARFNNFGAFTVGYEGEAWHESTYVGVLQAGSGAWIGQTPAAGARAEWVNNAYYDSVNTRWEYIAADEANRIYLENGELHLQSAAAGSADALITWNERLAMTVGGDFKIGPNAGIGITISSSGNVDAIGIVTASSFDGNLNASQLASGTVPTARLGSGTASSSTFLRGDSTFQTVNTDLVSDTTPQLGGTLDTNGNLIIFGDSSGSSDDRLKFGASNDMVIYHDGTRNIIDSQSSQLRIETDALRLRSDSGETYLEADANDAVKLYFNNAKKFETTSSGATVSGALTVTSNLLMGDGDKLRLGDSNDLELHHSGGENYIQGHLNQLYIRSAQGIYIQPNTNENGVVALANGAAELYYDNSKKIETSSGGATVTGVLNVAGGTSAYPVISLTSNDYVAKFESSDSYARLIVEDSNSTDNYNGLQVVGNNTMLICNNEVGIQCVGDGATELYHNANKVFETTSYGGKFQKSGEVITLIGSTDGSGVYLTLDGASNGDGAGGDHASIGHDNSGNLHIKTDSPASNVSIVFSTNATQRTIIDESGHLKPNSDNTYDLGTSSKRWRNVYTTDLQLSNKGKSNDVDGTWGDYTIQEGESDLFLINKRSGKKFKFMLQEVS